MASLDKIRETAEEVLASYVTRLTAVSQIISDANELLSKGRDERSSLEKSLRDILAETSSLRKKDFDEMMAGVMDEQTMREEAIRAALKRFVDDQTVLANRLKDELKNGNIESIRSIQSAIEKGLSQTMQLITDLRNEEQALLRRLKILVKMGPRLKITDFKKAVKEMQGSLTAWDA